MCWLIEQSKTLTTSDWAAWVQGISSVIAIIAASVVSIWQSRRQHTEAMKIIAEQRDLDRLESSRNLFAISRNCLQIVKQSALALNSREKIHEIAEGLVWFDLGGLKAIEIAANALPLHELAESLVTPAMRLSGAVRQLRTNVEVVLANHRTVDSEKFQEFSDTLKRLCDVIEAVNKDVEASALLSKSD